MLAPARAVGRGVPAIGGLGARTGGSPRYGAGGVVPGHSARGRRSGTTGTEPAPPAVGALHAAGNRSVALKWKKDAGANSDRKGRVSCTVNSPVSTRAMHKQYS